MTIILNQNDNNFKHLYINNNLCILILVLNHNFMVKPFVMNVLTFNKKNNKTYSIML